jgi:hypothetical protein
VPPVRARFYHRPTILLIGINSTDEAIAAWKAAPRTTPGGQPHYSDLAITTALTLRAVFHLALRQTEGLIGSELENQSERL